VPTLNIKQEFCDVCWSEGNHETLATDNVLFTWRAIERRVLVCDIHAKDVAESLQRLADISSVDDSQNDPRSGGRSGSLNKGRRVPSTSLFSKLSQEDKLAIRRDLDMPSARRIKDETVQNWLDSQQSKAG
jgi:hypothetical protein